MQSLSPGLRGTSYPGLAVVRTLSTLKGVAAALNPSRKIAVEFSPEPLLPSQRPWLFCREDGVDHDFGQGGCATELMQLLSGLLLVMARYPG